MFKIIIRKEKKSPISDIVTSAAAQKKWGGGNLIITVSSSSVQVLCFLYFSANTLSCSCLPDSEVWRVTIWVHTLLWLVTYEARKKNRCLVHKDWNPDCCSQQDWFSSKRAKDQGEGSVQTELTSCLGRRQIQVVSSAGRFSLHSPFPPHPYLVPAFAWIFDSPPPLNFSLLFSLNFSLFSLRLPAYLYP